MKRRCPRSLTDPLAPRRRRRSPTASCWRRWPGSATGSCACRPSATGPGLVVSEMVSSFAVHYRNERTCRELLRIHPEEHPVSVQLFGHDPDVMASAAERVAAAGADLIDINMGCPVPKVCKTGRRRRAARGPRRARWRWRGRRRAAAACRSRSSCARGSGPGDLSGRRGRPPAGRSTAAWPGICDPPPPRLPAPQGQARLRARARAGRGAAGAGADLRRAAHARAARAAFEQTGAAGGAAGARLARATRGCSSSCSGTRD